jgi:transketolase
MKTDIASAAKAMRLNILRLAAKAGKEGKGAHIAPSLSMVEILCVLHLKVMRPPDTFVLSKGHGGLAYYAALRESGVITGEQLDSFETSGGDFPGQPAKKAENGIAFSGGSLGLGLSYACGLAIAAKRQNRNQKIYVLLGDGELNEGSNWAAVMLARHHRLDNLVAIIDHNRMQSDGAASEILAVDLKSAFSSFGWDARECDGHCATELEDALSPARSEKPLAVFAKTVKGKGVSFMENNGAWHHARLNETQYQKSLGEVVGSGV